MHYWESMRILCWSARLPEGILVLKGLSNSTALPTTVAAQDPIPHVCRGTSVE